MMGQVPFGFMDDDQVVRTVREGKRPSLGRHKGPDGLTELVRELIERCWVQDAETRPEFTSILGECDTICRENWPSSVITTDSYVLATTVPTMDSWSGDINSLPTSINPPPQSAPSATGKPTIPQIVAQVGDGPENAVVEAQRQQPQWKQPQRKHTDIEVCDYQMTFGLV